MKNFYCFKQGINGACLVAGLLFSSSANAQTPVFRPIDGGSTIPPTLAIDGPTTACQGTVQTYYAQQTNDYSFSNCDSGTYTWTTNDPNALVNPSPYGDNSAQITWSGLGAHTIHAVLNPCTRVPSGYTVQGPAADFSVTVQSTPVPASVTVSYGTSSNTTATGTTICPGREIELTTPANAAYTWQWSGTYITQQVDERTIRVQPPTTTTYTLSATPKPGTACSLPSVQYTVSVLPRLDAPTVTGATRLGAGSLTLQVVNPLPGVTYNWYESTSTYAQAQPITGTGISANGANFITPSLSTSRSYYVAASSPTNCDAGYPQEVPVSILQVMIYQGTYPVTNTINLASGSSVSFTANPTTSASYTWRLGEQIMQQGSSYTYLASAPGIYTVEVSSNNLLVRSQQVVVTDALSGQAVNGQPLNYLSTVKVLQPGITNADAIQGLSAANRQQTVTYTDGLDRPVQEVYVQASANGSDLIDYRSYDGFGTAPINPSAYASTHNGRYASNANSEQYGFYYYGALYGNSKVTLDQQAFATTTYEASPLERVIAQTRPGSTASTHPAGISCQTNAGETDNSGVHIWQGLSGSGFYAANQLSVEVRTNEDQRETRIYRDKLNRVVLRRKVEVTSNGTNLLDTYSVYDDSGDEIYTIPPGAVARMRLSGQWTITDTNFIAKWLYQFKYDDLHRVVERTSPGAAVVAIVYDQFDRPILVRDGAHLNSGTWLFTKYDEQSRPVVEGVYNSYYPTRKQLQDAANAQTGEFETRVTGGYTTTSTYPSIQEGSNGNILSVNIYDDYDLDLNGSPDYSYRSQSLGTGVEPVQSSQTRKKLTLTRKRIVNGNGQMGDWITMALFYDEYGNVIQKQSNSILAPSTTLPNTTTIVYRNGGFTNQILQTLKRQSTGSFNQGEVLIKNRYSYLPNGQVSGVWQQNTLNGVTDAEVKVSASQYNPLNQLVEKNLHSRDGGVTFLQSEDFRYNLAGQLSHINNGSLTNDGRNNDDTNDLFGMDIVREGSGNNNGILQLTTTPRFDGGVSAVDWQAHNPTQTNNPERKRSYSFTYDGLGRLKDGLYAAQDGSGGWTLENGAYDEKGIAYDFNGNITALSRFTQRGAAYPVEQIDNLSYHYDTEGNQLLSVADLSNDPRGLNRSSTQNYSYNSDGHLYSDPNKNVNYSYNCLNKVGLQSISATNSRGASGNTTYDYDANGTLLRRTINGISTAGTPISKVSTYVDGLVYESSATQNGLAWVPTPEGRALLLPVAPTKFVYEYHLRDYLGNLRVAFRADRQPELLHLTMEPSANEEGTAPKFSNVTSSRSQAGVNYHGPSDASGAYAAAVSAYQAGPSTRMPVIQGDQLKVSLWYQTPSGTQYSANGPIVPVTGVAKTIPLWSVAPMIVPAHSASSHENNFTPNQQSLGLQVSATGLLTQAFTKRKSILTGHSAENFAKASMIEKVAYVDMRLYDEQNNLVREWQQVAPVVNTTDWSALRFLVTPDLSSLSSRTGYLEIQLMNQGSQAVNFDSLTIRRPNDAVLVSQENHYYPLGLAMSGVAVNTVPQAQTSKDLYNDGSSLEDDLLGPDGIYSTFYRTYDPVIGRFLSIDPHAPKYADWSPYQFALGNPLSYNDPTGADDWEFLFGTSSMSDFAYSEETAFTDGGSDGGSDGGWGEGGVDNSNIPDPEVTPGMEGIVCIGIRETEETPSSGFNWIGFENTTIGAGGIGWGANDALVDFAAEADEALKQTPYFKAVKGVSQGLFYAQIAVSSVQATRTWINSDRNWHTNDGNKWGVTTKASLDIAFGAIGCFGGPIGWAASGAYFLGDAAGLWGKWGEDSKEGEEAFDGAFK